MPVLFRAHMVKFKFKHTNLVRSFKAGMNANTRSNTDMDVWAALTHSQRPKTKGSKLTGRKIGEVRKN